MGYVHLAFFQQKINVYGCYVQTDKLMLLNIFLKWHDVCLTIACGKNSRHQSPRAAAEEIRQFMLKGF
jgi:hypothetical protein